MKEENKEEHTEFIRKLSKALTEIDHKAQFEGVCPQCFGTDKEMHKEGDYWGVVARKDGDIYTFSRCTHGENYTEDLGF